MLLLLLNPTDLEQKAYGVDNNRSYGTLDCRKNYFDLNMSSRLPMSKLVSLLADKHSCRSLQKFRLNFEWFVLELFVFPQFHR